MRIRRGDLGDPRVVRLLQHHADTARAQTGRGSAHALDPAALDGPDTDLWTIWDGGSLVGVGALRRIAPGHGEIKSMHVAEAMRGRGAGAMMLRHLIETSRAEGLSRLSLETGSWDYFRPAWALYRSHGFVEAAPFGDYALDPNSIFMTLDLAVA